MITYLRDRWLLFKQYKNFLITQHFYGTNLPLTLVYDVINKLDRNDTLARVRKFNKWPVSKRLINGPSFQQMIVDREFESGTFGAEFKKWSANAGGAVDLFKVSLEAAPRDRKASNLFDAFQKHSMMQHDLIHFFNGYDTTTMGEISVLSFHQANEWKRSWSFFMCVGAVVSLWVSFLYTVFPSKRPQKIPLNEWFTHLPFIDYIKWVREAYRRGKKSIDFIFVDWEKMFNKPLEDVKKEVGIAGSPDYWNKTKGVRIKWPYS